MTANLCLAAILGFIGGIVFTILLGISLFRKIVSISRKSKGEE
jgi:hypothetical protein